MRVRRKGHQWFDNGAYKHDKYYISSKDSLCSVLMRIWKRDAKLDIHIFSQA